MRGAVAAAALWVAASTAPAGAQDDGPQEQVFRRIEVRGGKPVQIAVLPNLKADCSNGPLPEFKILKAPAHGAIIARRGRMHTGAKHRCPNTDALAQILFYQASPNYDGSDEIAVEVTSPEGRKTTASAQIDVRRAPEKPKASPMDL